MPWLDRMNDFFSKDSSLRGASPGEPTTTDSSSWYELQQTAKRLLLESRRQLQVVDHLKVCTTCSGARTGSSHRKDFFLTSNLIIGRSTTLRVNEFKDPGSCSRDLNDQQIDYTVCWWVDVWTGHDYLTIWDALRSHVSLIDQKGNCALSFFNLKGHVCLNVHNTNALISTFLKMLYLVADIHQPL